MSDDDIGEDSEMREVVRCLATATCVPSFPISPGAEGISRPVGTSCMGTKTLIKEQW